MSLTKLEPEQRQAVVDRFRDKRGRIHCARCEKVVFPGGFELDHIRREVDTLPAVRSDLLNIQVLCKSCHKRKTAAEAALDAKRVRGGRDWARILTSASLSVVTLGLLAADMSQHQGGSVPFTPEQWLRGCATAGILTLCTFLVQKRFGSARPLESVSAEPKPEPATQVNPLPIQRIVDAVREITGPKGTITVTGVPDDFTVTYAGTGFADHDDEKRLELLSKLSAKIGDRWLPWWDTKADRVRFTRRPALPRKIHHPGLAPERAWNVLPVATGVAFDLLMTSHLLIIGEPNAGKTALMRTLIVAVLDSARRGETEMILADPKQIEMLGFRGWPGVRNVVSETEALWDMAFRVEAEMNRRYTLLRDEKVPLSSHKRLIVVIDEYEQFYKRMFRYWTTALDEEGKPLKKGPSRVPGAIDAIQSVLSMARRCGIHLIIGTQSPDAAWFGGSGARENMAGRVSVGPLDSIRARMMFGDAAVGRDIPSNLKGRATIQIGDGVPQEIQTFWTPDPFDADGTNDQEDWGTLFRLGMPKELIGT